MRRLILLMLILCVPLQFSWAAVSGFCNHERSSVVHHSGDHTQMHADHSVCHPMHQTEGAAQDLTGTDHDCCQCHSHSIGFAPGFPSEHIKAVSIAPVSAHEHSLPFGLIDRPDRPNWPRLA